MPKNALLHSSKGDLTFFFLWGAMYSPPIAKHFPYLDNLSGIEASGKIC